MTGSEPAGLNSASHVRRKRTEAGGKSETKGGVAQSYIGKSEVEARQGTTEEENTGGSVHRVLEESLEAAPII